MPRARTDPHNASTARHIAVKETPAWHCGHGAMTMLIPSGITNRNKSRTSAIAPSLRATRATLAVRPSDLIIA